MALTGKRRLRRRASFSAGHMNKIPNTARICDGCDDLMFEQGVSGVPLTAEKRAEAIRLAHSASRAGSDDAFTLARSGHVLTYLGGEYDRGASM